MTAGGKDWLAFFGLGEECAPMVLAANHSVPGPVEVVAAEGVARRLAERGLPGRWWVRPGKMADDLPRGEPLLFVRDDWPERPIAVVRDGRVVIGFDPDEAVRATLAERGREPARPVTEGLPFFYQRVPPALRLAAARLLVRLGKLAVRGEAATHAESADALRFALLFGLEAARRQAGAAPPEPRPFWPQGKRFAVALTHDVDSAEGVARIPFLRVPEVICHAPSTWFVVGGAARGDLAMLEGLSREGCEVAAHDDVHDNRLPYLAPGEIAARLEAAGAAIAPLGAGPLGFRSPSLARSEALFEALAPRFAYDSSVPDDDGGGGGCGSVFPFRRAGGLLELPVTLPLDADCAFRGLTGGETLALWRAGLERVRRAGGLAVLVTHPEPHFSGGSAELAQAYATFVAEVCWDEEAWVATAGAIARWWAGR